MTTQDPLIKRINLHVNTGDFNSMIAELRTWFERADDEYKSKLADYLATFLDSIDEDFSIDSDKED